MKLETINKKIEKQQAKVEALKEKYDEAAKRYTEEEKVLKSLIKTKNREMEKERERQLTTACKEKKIDINTVVDIIKSGKLDVLLDAMQMQEAQKKQEKNSESQYNFSGEEEVKDSQMAPITNE